jgi:hypothetical protein
MSAEIVTVINVKLFGCAANNALHLIRVIGACLSRPEIRQYTKNFTESCKTEATTEEAENLHRFPRINRQRQNTDLLSLNPSYESLDQALANESLAEPFLGPQACPYCPTILQVSEPKDYLLHLFDHHVTLTKAYFTCPAVIAICIYDKNTYPAHYTEVHSQASALIMLFLQKQQPTFGRSKVCNSRCLLK